MQENICLAQDIKELKYIINNIRFKKFKVLPLNLATYLYTISNKIEYIDPITLIDNAFHRQTILKVYNLKNKVKFEDNIDINIKNSVLAFLRSRSYSYFFLKKILKNYLKNKNYKFVISGWQTNQYSGLNENDYIIEELLKRFVTNNQIIKINKTNKKKILPLNIYDYVPDKFFKFKKNNKKILLNNLGYNFKRLIIISFFKKISIYVLSFQKINILKNFLLNLLGVKIIRFKKIIITHSYPKYPIIKSAPRFLNFFLNKANFFFEDLYRKNQAIKSFLFNKKFDLILSNISLGEEGGITNKINREKTNSICISHGTIAKSFNKFDKIYKRSIADAVFSGDSKFFALQSKITADSLSTYKIKGKIIKTGNLVFSYSKKILKNKKYILVASTQKDFNNMQLLGVEMFYEYYKTISYINKIALNSKFKFIVKLHPNEMKNIHFMKYLFPNLYFSNQRIDRLLKKTFVLISYSSSVIEDALNCYVPVILFDPWNRYQHCKAEKNFKTKNKCVYYINKKDFLPKILETIYFSKNIIFKNYIYNTNALKNFKKLLDKFI